MKSKVLLMGYRKEILTKITNNILGVKWTRDKFQRTVRNVIFYCEDLCNIYEETEEKKQFYFQ